MEKINQPEISTRERFLSKQEIARVPFECKITDYKDKVNLTRRDGSATTVSKLFLTGNYNNVIGDYSLIVNLTDKAILAQMFGEDWLGLNPDKVYLIGAMATGKIFTTNTGPRAELILTIKEVQ